MRSVLQRPSQATRRRRLRAGTLLSACVVAVLVASLVGSATAAPTAATTTSDDPTVVSDWNEIAVTTLAGDTTKQGIEHVLYTAFVQAAVYDAVVGVKGRYEPYSFHARARRGTSAQAAAVAAAHKVLVTYSPAAQATLDAAYAASLAQLPDGQAKARGIAFGPALPRS